MFIRHNIKRNGCKLEGQILETIFEDGEKRGEVKDYYSKNYKFSISSRCNPALYLDLLCVWGYDVKSDSNTVSCVYDSEEEAQQALDYINEFTIEEEKEPDNAWKIQTITDKQKEKVETFIKRLEAHFKGLTASQQNVLINKINKVKGGK